MSQERQQSAVFFYLSIFANQRQGKKSKEEYKVCLFCYRNINMRDLQKVQNNINCENFIYGFQKIFASKLSYLIPSHINILKSPHIIANGSFWPKTMNAKQIELRSPFFSSCEDL